MPWFKIDDGFHNHPRILAAGNAATGLFVRVGSYCSQHITDGVIPAVIATSYGTRQQIDTLLSLGLIEPHPDGYVIPDFLDFNPSAEKVRAGRAEAAERQRKHREAKEASRRESQRDKRVTSEPVTATPTRPDPTRPTNKKSSSVLTVVPDPTGPTDDDPFESTITLIVDALEQAWAGRITKPRSWRHAVRKNTITEDGELIRRMLADDPPEQVALFVLGHGQSTIETRAEQPKCPHDCECKGEGYIGTTDDHGVHRLAPCPGRTA